MNRWLGISLVLALVIVNTAPLEPHEAVGGISWFCPALGVLTGLSVATGQWISAAGFAVTAIRAGCVA